MPQAPVTAARAPECQKFSNSENLSHFKHAYSDRTLPGRILLHLAREAKRKGDGARCVNCGCELRLRERLVRFLRCKFNNIGRALEDRWKL